MMAWSDPDQRTPTNEMLRLESSTVLIPKKGWDPIDQPNTVIPASLVSISTLDFFQKLLGAQDIAGKDIFKMRVIPGNHGRDEG